MARPNGAATTANGEVATATSDEPVDPAARVGQVATVPPPTGWQFVLEQGGQRAVVTEVGGALRSWRVGDRELLDGFGVEEAGDDFRGKLLLPWPNRICGGRYQFAGCQQRTPLTEPERNAALHGLVLWESFRPVGRSAHELVLAHRLHPQPGYPFTLDLQVTYALGAAGLSLTIVATNIGDRTAPFGAGFHPYLTLGDATIDGALLEVRAAPGTEPDFRTARPIGGLELDTCFAHHERDSDGRASTCLIAPAGERELRMWMDDRFGYLQVYTGDAVADPRRRRRGVALVPMTCAPDAFNTGEGLITLAPGETFTGRCGLEAIGF